MPRPKLQRRVCSAPRTTFYKPRGVPLRILEIVEVTLEEWEALRLRHEEGLNQTESAKRMQTSQSTFQRILSGAQKKIAGAVVNGKAVKIVK